MATTPNFTNGARLTKASLSAANTNRDGTGTIVTVIIGVTGGTKVNRVTVQNTVTTTAGMVRLFLSLDIGITWALFDEIPITAITVSASVAGSRIEKPYSDLELPSTSAILGATTHNAEAAIVWAHVGDFT